MDPGSILSSLGGDRDGDGRPDAAALVGGLLEQFTGQGAGGQGVAGGAGLAGGIGGLVEQLRATGIADQVMSWVAKGDNLPVAPDALGAALGPERIDALSKQTGVSVDQLLPTLAAALPTVVDALTPDGRVPAEGAGIDVGGVLGSLGGLLGKDR